MNTKIKTIIIIEGGNKPNIWASEHTQPLGNDNNNFETQKCRNKWLYLFIDGSSSIEIPNILNTL